MADTIKFIRPPMPDGIENLQTLMEDVVARIRTGEVVALGVVCITRDGVFTLQPTKSEHTLEVLGGIEVLKKRILERYADDDD